MEEIISSDPLLTLFILVMLPLGLLVLILWTVVPFSVFGIKSRLNKMIEHLEEISAHQQVLIRLVKEMVHVSPLSQDRLEQHPEEEEEEGQDV